MCAHIMATGAVSVTSLRRRPTGISLEVQRTVPKFLQQYAHLLEKGPKKRRRPVADEADDNDDDDDGDAVRAT